MAYIDDKLQVGDNRMPELGNFAVDCKADSPGSDQLCYQKDGGGWKIAGYIGVGTGQD